MDDCEVIIDWINDTIMVLQNPSVIALNYNKEGEVAAMIMQEDSCSGWLTIFWTSFTGTTGYQILSKHSKKIRRDCNGT